MDGTQGMVLYMQHDHKNLSNRVIMNTSLSSTTRHVTSEHHLVSPIAPECKRVIGSQMFLVIKSMLDTIFSCTFKVQARNPAI